jgi:hypothetical protein
MHLTIQLLGLFIAGKFRELIYEFAALFSGNEPGGLHRIDQ